MATAYRISHPLKLTYPNGVGVFISARMLYFPDDRLAILPDGQISLDATLTQNKPVVLRDEEAEQTYLRAVGQGSAIDKVEVDPVILSWAKLNSEILPSRSFRRKIFHHLFPYLKPYSVEAEVVTYGRPESGIERLVTGIFVEATNTFMEIDAVDSQPQRTSYVITAYYGSAALQRYAEISGRIIDTRSSSIDLPTLDLIIESAESTGEKQQLLLGQILVQLSENGLNF